MNQTCPQCGTVVGDRGLHSSWHRELDRRLAGLEDDHRAGRCHEASQARELARVGNRS